MRPSKRKIVVDGRRYHWILRGNTLYGKDRHILIVPDATTRCPLYLDPYAWELEIRPQTIGDVILFTLDSGWEPESSGPPLFVGMVNSEFVVLPEGVRFVHLLEDSDDA